MMDHGDHLVEWFPFSSYSAIMDLFRKREVNKIAARWPAKAVAQFSYSFKKRQLIPL